MKTTTVACAFADWDHDLKGNNDLLSLTRPEIIREHPLTHSLTAGADIIETNTFNSNAPSMADYGMQELVAELNLAAARLARRVCGSGCMPTRTGSRASFVAGALGPTNRTASISRRTSTIPGFRNISFRPACGYLRGLPRCALIEGGVDFLLIETIFDTLNAKAAIMGSAPQTFRASWRRNSAGDDLRYDHGCVGSYALGTNG